MPIVVAGVGDSKVIDCGLIVQGESCVTNDPSVSRATTGVLSSVVMGSAYSQLKGSSIRVVSSDVSVCTGESMLRCGLRTSKAGSSLEGIP